MSGRLPWVAATVVIVIAAGLGAWALSTPATQTSTPGTSGSTPTYSFQPVQSLTGAWALTGDNGGIENIYIMQQTGKTWENNADLYGNGQILATLDDNNDSVNIAYETPFAIVVVAHLYAPDNMAYGHLDNIYVYMTTTGEFALEENGLVAADNEFCFDNENYDTTASSVRVNIVNDNAGAGWVLRAGQSLTLSEITVYGWK